MEGANASSYVPTKAPWHSGPVLRAVSRCVGPGITCFVCLTGRLGADTITPRLRTAWLFAQSAGAWRGSTSDGEMATVIYLSR
jgi:hypothetical protein